MPSKEITLKNLKVEFPQITAQDIEAIEVLTTTTTVVATTTTSVTTTAKTTTTEASSIFQHKLVS